MATINSQVEWDNFVNVLYIRPLVNQNFSKFYIAMVKRQAEWGISVFVLCIYIFLAN